MRYESPGLPRRSISPRRGTGPRPTSSARVRRWMRLPRPCAPRNDRQEMFPNGHSSFLIPHSSLLTPPSAKAKPRQLSLSGFCVGIDLSSRSVSRQVLSALVSLTSVFGMGTGGPSPLKTPTICIWLAPSTLPCFCPLVKDFLWAQVSIRPEMVHHQGLEPWTP